MKGDDGGGRQTMKGFLELALDLLYNSIKWNGVAVGLLPHLNFYAETFFLPVNTYCHEKGHFRPNVSLRPKRAVISLITLYKFAKVPLQYSSSYRVASIKLTTFCCTFLGLCPISRR